MTGAENNQKYISIHQKSSNETIYKFDPCILSNFIEQINSPSNQLLTVLNLYIILEYTNITEENFKGH